VKSIKVAKFNGEKQEIEVNGVFVSLGKEPATKTFNQTGINFDEKGCVVVDRWQRTNIDGVLAAGDCTCGGMQVVTAVGEGAMAAIKAMTYIKNLNYK
jgi:thioredoxin reductase (NADPH)